MLDAPFCPSAVLVGTDDGGVDHRIFIVGILGQTLEHSLPDAASTPARMARVDHSEISEPLRQITPCDPSAVTIYHRFNKQPVIFGRPSDMARTARQNIRDPLLLVIT